MPLSVSTTTFLRAPSAPARLRERFSCATRARAARASASPSSVNDSSERNPAAA